jgi:hypothetical protein
MLALVPATATTAQDGIEPRSGMGAFLKLSTITLYSTAINKAFGLT